MTSPILFLTVRMAQGYGVTVVVEELCRRLLDMGVPCVVGCQAVEGDFHPLDVRVVKPESASVEALRVQLGARIVVALSSPFYEVLPLLDSSTICLAWENGDPTPEFFPDDGKERSRIVENKKRNIYPHMAGFIAISEFIKSEIEVPSTHVIYLGCDHVPDQGPKELGWFKHRNKPLRVGTLTRLGTGESRYKGTRLFFELQRACKEYGVAVQLEVMGRGTAEDAAVFQEAGLQVHLNATDEERAHYLRELDVFISCSQWEGFNLPLVEAQAAGTVAFAFDVGAHPEVTPFVMSSLAEVVLLLKQYAHNSALCAEHSKISYHFVRKRFKWQETANQFLKVIDMIQDGSKLKTKRMVVSGR